MRHTIWVALFVLLFSPDMLGQSAPASNAAANRKDGSFSTNYLRAGVNHSWNRLHAVQHAAGTAPVAGLRPDTLTWRNDLGVERAARLRPPP